MTLGHVEGHTAPSPADSHELALSILTEPQGDMRLVLAANIAGRWVVWCDDTEDTACLLESLPHLHLVGQTHTASGYLSQIQVANPYFFFINSSCSNRLEGFPHEHDLQTFSLKSWTCIGASHEALHGSLTSLAWSTHRPTTAPPLPGNFTAEPNCKKKQKRYKCIKRKTLLQAHRWEMRNKTCTALSREWKPRTPTCFAS